MKKLLTTIFLFLILLFPQTVFAQDPVTTGKLITVDLSKEMLYAWDGGQIVYQTPVSIGLPHTPTVRGTFHIYWKLPSQEMKGCSTWYGCYDLKNVPNVMYFYQDYAIHGAYWVTNFGVPHSHGCVNTPLPAAAWLYNWAPVGTTVMVY